MGHRQLAAFAHIMNLNLSTGSVPSAWKLSRISPIFKEGDTLNINNYRPISVIPTCMKFFEKLKKNIGVQGLELNWFSSYLNGRKQVTKIGEHYSSSTVVTSGVLQGSVLGPLPFTLYINDLANILPVDS